MMNRTVTIWSESIDGSNLATAMKTPPHIKTTEQSAR
jgi:hypothetical protein